MTIFAGDPVMLARGWEGYADLDRLPGADWTARGPAGSTGYAPNAVLTHSELPPDLDLVEWSVQSLAALRESLGLFSVIDQRLLDLDGVLAVAYLTLFWLQGRSLSQWQYYRLLDSTNVRMAAVLTLTCSSGDYDQLSQTFEEMMAGFEPERVIH